MEISSILMEKEKLENFLGISLKRVELTPKSAEPYDEKFANLCHRFAGKEGETDEAIRLATKLLTHETRSRQPTLSAREISLLFSIVGTLYYLQEHYEKSIGCFMKALSWYREDMVPWIELMFAIRAAEDYSTFENIIFNLEGLFSQWRISTAEELTKHTLMRMIETHKAR